MKTTLSAYPELLMEWNAEKNGPIKPDNIPHRSNHHAWWKCKNGHEWSAVIASRTRKSGCPYCSGRCCVLDESLAATHPDIAAQWHPEKNGDLKPCDFRYASHQKIWWKCKQSVDHEWESRIADRTNGDSVCPCCSNYKAVPSNCLATTHPEIAFQWDFASNIGTTPNDVTAYSNKKVWWVCSKGYDHKWKATIIDRHKAGCPCCSNKKLVTSNCLATTHPEVAAQWHPLKNKGLTPADVVAGTCKKVWWLCDVGEDHEWISSVKERANRKDGCPFCANKRVAQSNRLSTTHPDLAAQWHSIKNNELTPSCVTYGTALKVWWQCATAHHHVWKCSVVDRTYAGHGCPYCKESKGERAVAKALSRLNIFHVREWKFNSCRNINPLPFDFIIRHNGKTALIEFQGIQHYKPVGFGGDKHKTFDKIKINDGIKESFCKKRGYPLLQIPYWKLDSVHEIVHQFVESMSPTVFIVRSSCGGSGRSAARPRWPRTATRTAGRSG